MTNHFEELIDPDVEYVTSFRIAKEPTHTEKEPKVDVSCYGSTWWCGYSRSIRKKFQALSRDEARETFRELTGDDAEVIVQAGGFATEEDRAYVQERRDSKWISIT